VGRAGFVGGTFGGCRVALQDRDAGRFGRRQGRSVCLFFSFFHVYLFCGGRQGCSVCIFPLFLLFPLFLIFGRHHFFFSPFLTFLFFFLFFFFFKKENLEVKTLKPELFASSSFPFAEGGIKNGVVRGPLSFCIVSMMSCG